MDASGLEPALTCGISIVYLLAEFEPLTIAIYIFSNDHCGKYYKDSVYIGKDLNPFLLLAPILASTTLSWEAKLSTHSGTRSWLRSKLEWCMRPLCTLVHLVY